MATSSRTPAKSKPAQSAAPRPAARKRAPASATPPAKTAATEKAPAVKAAKLKLVRDSFTIPREEYGAIDALKLRLAKLGRISKKSEVLRAGLKLLAALPDASLAQAMEAVPSIKTGRPKSKKAKSATSVPVAAA